MAFSVYEVIRVAVCPGNRHELHEQIWVLDKLGRIPRHHYKERLKISELVKFEGDAS